MLKSFINFKTLAIVVLITAFMSACNKPNKEQMNKEFQAFAQKFDSLYIPLYKGSCLAYWNASISGKPEDWKIVEDISFKVNAIFSNKEDFAILKKLKESGMITDEIPARQLEVLYLSYLSSQVDTAKLNAVTRMQTMIEQKYGNFRAIVGKDTLTDNMIEEVLKTSKDNKKLEDTWKAHKNIGPVVNQDIIKLVKLRNEVAKELGFNTYHEMSLKLSEQDPTEIEKLFDQLDSLTKESFIEVKSEMDDYFATRYKIKKEELMPWHYQNRYFQEAPKIYKVELDKYYKDKDLVKLTNEFYSGIDTPVDDIMKNSDLFEKPGKNQHAYCIDIDNEGDIRVLCNVKPNENWMGTMLHEFGHASYDKYIDRSLPFVLRNPAHTFTTEAIAMIFGRFSTNPQWIKDMTGISDKEKEMIAEDSYKSLRLQQLVFSRWAQVMYRFEKSLYENPDQDLNKLWWDLVEKYQMVKKPADRNQPDWATKIHIATSPCYYHNYLLGELLASQLHHYICQNIIKTDDWKNQSFVGNKEIGKYLIEKVYMPGARYQWNDMIEKATGEKLTPKYYAGQFIK